MKANRGTQQHRFDGLRRSFNWFEELTARVPTRP